MSEVTQLDSETAQTKVRMPKSQLKVFSTLYPTSPYKNARKVTSSGWYVMYSVHIVFHLKLIFFDWLNISDFKDHFLRAWCHKHISPQLSGRGSFGKEILPCPAAPQMKTQQCIFLSYRVLEEASDEGRWWPSFLNISPT